MSAHYFITAAGVVCSLVWLYLLFGRGKFWSTAITKPSEAPLRRVIAIVPARDEAELIGRCVQSLLGQRAVNLSVIVVDDHSTDGTADVAHQASILTGTVDRLTTLSGQELPPEWTGKL